MSWFSKSRLTLMRWLQRLLYLLLKTRQIGTLQADQQQGERLRVYAFMYASLAEQLVIDREVEAFEWSRPLDHGNGGLELSPFFHVYRRSGRLFRKQAKPVLSKSLQQLAQWQMSHPQQNIEVVPVRIYWGRGPQKEGSFLRIWLQNSGTIGGRLFTLMAILINGRNTFVHLSQPVSMQRLAEGSNSASQLARKTALLLRKHFRLVNATVIGPDLSHRRTLISQLPNRPLVHQAIEQACQDGQLTPQRARQRALRYADEIASNISYTTVRFLDVLLGWVWNSLYDGVKLHNIDALKTAARDNEVVYVPCHRSHIDYLLLSYVLYQHGLQLPQIAAGINLNIPVVGPILRRGGAFFIRRSFRDNPLYGAVFDEYLHSIFSRGYSAEYFVEGGRSRTGRTLQPKAGMLAMTLRSYLRDSRKPILFMPVYIGYEKVFEGSTYQKELRGQKKRKESLLGIVSTLKSFGRDFGKVHVTFGEPVYLTSFLNQQQPGWREQEFESCHYRPDWAPAVVDCLARRVVTEINRSAVVNPINLVGLTLLASPREAMPEAALKQRLQDWAAMITAAPLSPLTHVSDGTPAEWIKHAESLAAISRQTNPLGDLIYADDRQAVALTYYRNNVLHLLAIPGMIGCLLIHRQAISRQQILDFIGALYPFVQAELFLPWQVEELPRQLELWLQQLCDKGYLQTDGENFQAIDDREASYEDLDAMARVMMPTLERYYITLALLQHHGSDHFSASALEQQSALIAQRVSLLHGVNSPEFFDSSLFRTLVSQLQKQQMLAEQEQGMLTTSSALEQLANRLSHAVDGSVQNTIRRCL
ncbi:glycerol-3-phosphate 1-O-acyltransferase PlsB [Oceanobacter mangrovi]|uniref:glycerol-3-phosphate 1-O-acyltransferase PlsB n=1 Tax=Oceanobacter mangrovi TaxID=2862510 RepID=UPI001C8DA314|nr:glycerol-3-phosphate 1-O-acyltransferase PlsB [Oceanobacter mangrovi]